MWRRRGREEGRTLLTEWKGGGNNVFTACCVCVRVLKAVLCGDTVMHVYVSTRGGGGERYTPAACSAGLALHQPAGAHMPGRALLPGIAALELFAIMPQFGRPPSVHASRPVLCHRKLPPAPSNHDTQRSLWTCLMSRRLAAAAFSPSSRPSVAAPASHVAEWIYINLFW